MRPLKYWWDGQNIWPFFAQKLVTQVSRFCHEKPTSSVPLLGMIVPVLGTNSTHGLSTVRQFKTLLLHSLENRFCEI